MWSSLARRRDSDGADAFVPVIRLQWRGRDVPDSEGSLSTTTRSPAAVPP